MNASTLTGILMVAIAYALGTLPFGVWFARWVGGTDPRRQGSRNIGSTNVLRVAGKRAAALTLAADVGKGAMGVWVAQLTLPLASPWPELAGIAAVVGHIFPVWSGFRGGKGVATAIGALLVLSFPVAVAAIGVWSAVLALSRYVSLSSVASAATVLVAAGVAGLDAAQARIFMIIVPALVIVRHSENLVRLWNGKEYKLGEKRP